MSETGQHQRNWSASALPVGSMAAVVSMIVSRARIGRDIPPYSMESFAVFLGPLVLLVGILLSRNRPRLGYIVTASGAVLPLPWVLMTETRGFGNSWISMNASRNDADTFRYMHYSQLRILSVALLLMTLIWAVTRLLPSQWQLRNSSVNRRTWPAIAITLIFVVCWFATSALPYRQPGFVDAVQPAVSILHVKKDGIAFHETRINVYRDGRYYVVRSDRQLFRYSFLETVHEGLLTDNLRLKLKAVQNLPELKQTLDRAPRTLRGQHGEGWYTKMGRFSITAFTTENATRPPADVATFLLEVEGAPSIGPSSRYEVRDVCLGFCYDPKAGLGYRAENERCAARPDGKEICD
jgi:hypothetical protein